MYNSDFAWRWFWNSVIFMFLGITTSFQKSNIGWPHQPPTEKVPILVTYWIFDDPFLKEGPLFIIGHFVAMDQGQEVLCWNREVEVDEAIAVAEAVEVNVDAQVIRPGKLLLRNSKSSRFLNSALFWYFEKKIFGRIWKYHVEF